MSHSRYRLLTKQPKYTCASCRKPCMMPVCVVCAMATLEALQTAVSALIRAGGFDMEFGPSPYPEHEEDLE